MSQSSCQKPISSSASSCSTPLYRHHDDDDDKSTCSDHSFPQKYVPYHRPGFEVGHFFRRHGLHILLAVLVILLFVLLIRLIVKGMSSGSDSSSSSDSSGSSSSPGHFFIGLFTILFFMFVIFLFIAGLLYLLGYDSIFHFQRLFVKLNAKINANRKDDKLDASHSGDNLNPSPHVKEMMYGVQVFNVPDNNFTYTDAKGLCRAYGARLATYSEVEDAYNKGGEWCSYGWSDGQMILYPTQKSSWDKLQGIPGHEKDCGRPGINGGHIADASMKFGANCYGHKPRITEEEARKMAQSPFPKSDQELEVDQRTKYWSSLLPEIPVSPYNHQRWSQGLGI
jgi:hypothetical protein